MLRNWQGIRSDTADTADDGALFVANPAYHIDGELRRRPGMEGFGTTVSGTAISGYYNGMTGNWAIFVTAAGTVEAVAAP